MSKKQKKEQHELVGRRTWEINPMQKVIPNKKRYNRRKEKNKKYQEEEN